MWWIDKRINVVHSCLFVFDLLLTLLTTGRLIVDSVSFVHDYHRTDWFYLYEIHTQELSRYVVTDKIAAKIRTCIFWSDSIFSYHWLRRNKIIPGSLLIRYCLWFCQILMRRWGRNSPSAMGQQTDLVASCRRNTSKYSTLLLMSIYILYNMYISKEILLYSNY